MEYVESTEVSDETCRRELFPETNVQREHSFFLHVESTEVFDEICRRELFSETRNAIMKWVFC